jgi:acyl-CoA thioester hydrolase
VQEQHIEVMRHTNNVVYLQCLEDIAWVHFTQLGLSPEQYTASGHGLVVPEHTLAYLQATRLGKELLLGTWLTEIDKLSLHRPVQLVRASDGAMVLRGRTHFVCIEIEYDCLRRMLPEFNSAFSAAENMHHANVGQ